MRNFLLLSAIYLFSLQLSAAENVDGLTAQIDSLLNAADKA